MDLRRQVRCPLVIAARNEILAFVEQAHGGQVRPVRALEKERLAV